MTELFDRAAIALGAAAGLAGVAMAAVAAHALGGLDAASFARVQSGVEIELTHAPALVLTGIWARRGGLLARLAAGAFALGLIAFCGSVYTLGLTGHSLGALAPAGGVLLMAGWALLGLSALRAA